jgi:hypothetical protein
LPGQPEFFVDRSLGATSIADGLRAEGFALVTIAEFYGKREAQHIADPTWIRDATERGLVLLHADKRVRYNPLEKAAMLEVGACSFALSNNNLSGLAVVARFVKHRDRIEQVILERDGPYFYQVYDDKIESRPLKWGGA